ncbi:hypothetical protein EON63_08280 [archaeon]|nr:MAG: hypothetical protein EON63_08280 [archaeon]
MQYCMYVCMYVCMYTPYTYLYRWTLKDVAQGLGSWSREKRDVISTLLCNVVLSGIKRRTEAGK